MEITSVQDPNDPLPPHNPAEKSRKDPSQCRICGASALYSYYGAIVCFSCKIFFKRNAARKQGQQECRFGDNCDVTIHNRHICSACRLRKCFASGMQTELFRSSISKSDRARSKQETNATARRTTADVVAQLPTISLLQYDQSILTTEQWTLLSNLIHCYDEHSTFAVAKQFLRDQNNLPIKMRYKVGPTQDLISACTGGGQPLFEKNAAFVSLSSHDRRLLLRNTMKHVGGLNTCFVLDRLEVLRNPAFCKSAEIIYGALVVHYTQRACTHLDHDPVFTKLMLTVLIFSTPDHVCYTNTSADHFEDAATIFRFQAMYLELIWRYLVYRYDHRQAVLCFAKFLRTIFAIHNSIIIAIDNPHYLDLIDALIRRTEATLSIDS